MLPEQLQRVQQQVVEVHRVGGLAARRPGPRRRRPRPGPAGRTGTTPAASSDAGTIRFLAAEMSDWTARGGNSLVEWPRWSISRLDEAEPVVLVVDGELPAEPDQLRLAPEQPGRQRVERADPEARRVPVEQPADPLLHLARGLVGECHREDPIGRHAVPIDQVRDARGEHARLARARPGQHQDRSVDVLHRLMLGRVERVLEYARRYRSRGRTRQRNAHDETGSLVGGFQHQSVRRGRPRPRGARGRGRCPTRRAWW